MHFVVGIIHKENEHIDELLAPFDESERREPYVEYTKEQLIAKGRAGNEEYKNGMYAKYLENPEVYKEKCSENLGHIKYLEEEFPKRMKWTDEQVYEDELKWYDKEDIGKNGEVYSTYNPDGKWDWYQIGGRWSSLLKLRNGTKPFLEGEKSHFDKDNISPKGWCDSTRLKNIDWLAMETKWNYDILETWRKAQIPEVKKTMYFCDVKDKETKEEYLAKKPLSLVYALLVDGEWTERDDRNEEDRKEWSILQIDILKKLVDERPDEILTIVDYHT